MEEGLRYDAPVQGMFRTTTGYVEMHGVTLPACARVFVVFGAANRDEHIFTHPDRFDLWRPNADPSISPSGMACHYCLGAALCFCLEARIANLRFSRSVCRMYTWWPPGKPLAYLPRACSTAPLQHLQVR